jgi:hypothetical protein
MKTLKSLKVEFVENLKSNQIQLCMGGIESALQESTIDRTLNILRFAIEKAGHKIKFSGRKYNKAEHWFDEECELKETETKMTLVEYKVKDYDVSRFKYWKCRKEYYSILEKKKKSWQEKQSEFLNNLIKQKEVKKIWGAVRNILKKNYYLPTVTPENWIKHFSNLFFNTAGELLTYELQALGPQYVE